MSWSKEQVLAFAAEEVRIGRLATVSAGGDPHVEPIWYASTGIDSSSTRWPRAARHGTSPAAPAST